MLKIFETEKIRELDRYTIDHEPVASIDLVERAATAFVREYSLHFTKQRRVIVFAGYGNNGADALAVARLLAEDNYRVEVCLINPARRLSPDCELNKARLLTVPKVDFVEVSGDENYAPPKLPAHEVVVIDGLFGSGLNRPLEAGYAGLVEYIHQSGAKVVSIDIPSGLFGEDNAANRPQGIMRADWTWTFEFPKLAFFLSENAPYTGKWNVLPVGIHPAIVEQTETPYYMLTDEDIPGLIRPRATFAHKGVFGHALLIAGSKGRTGAAVLAASACLRSGAGLLTVHLPFRGETALQTSLPEAMLSLDTNEDFVSELPELTPYDAIGTGPGLGTQAASQAVLEALLTSAEKPLVLDADALNILSMNRAWIAALPPRTLLTPHPKEFDRLFGDCASGYERLHKAMDMAREHELVIVLKGAYTAICTPEGNVYVNVTGNPGMATAGSGDVLTGILLGLLAQGYPPETAAQIGVYLHGLAGNLAAADCSQESMIAGDLIRMLGKAFKLQKDENPDDVI
ncbi:MAG: NAD(P)H-hydrate dehydratase [Tannerella sp.]|jgi:NAD(P)H-hydrate epimerase|nr:NAD(P)H-hydrate dehydratase [Tannerella sp.]